MLRFAEGQSPASFLVSDCFIKEAVGVKGLGSWGGCCGGCGILAGSVAGAGVLGGAPWMYRWVDCNPSIALSSAEIENAIGIGVQDSTCNARC